jgi:hypothetical protein
MTQRWKMSPNQSMVTDPDGDWVEYSDHLAALAEKDREIERLQTNIDVMKRALRWSECEEDWDG